MTMDLFTRLLQEFSILGGLLLVGFFLRAKLRVLQRLFLPASVIGGFIGLLLGPVVLKSYAILRFPAEIIADFSLLPGILIVPIIASVPLGIGMDKGSVKTSTSRNAVLPMFLLSVACAFGMFGLGFAVNMGFTQWMPELEIYPAFGMELSLGFAGGHGTAGLMGNVLQKLNLPYWEVAQGVTITSATVGLIGGIVLGMVLINIAARKNKITHLVNPDSIPEEIRQGYQIDISRQELGCRETTHSSSIDSLTLHAAIIFGVCGLSYLVVDLLKAYHVPLFSNIFAWAYAIVIMLIVNLVLKRLELSFLIDQRIKTKFTSFLVDFSIVAAISSLPVEAVLQFALPMIIMFVLGFVLVYLVLLVLGQYVFIDYPFERGIALFGQNTGVIMTGILLLRICDPDMKTPVLRDFSISYALATMLLYALLLPVIRLLPNVAAIFFLCTTVAIVAIVVSLIHARLSRGKPVS